MLSEIFRGALHRFKVMAVASVRRSKLLTVAPFVAGGFLAYNCFVPPEVQRPSSHARDAPNVGTRKADSDLDGAPAFSSAIVAPLLASVIILAWGTQPAHAFLPEEEQQGYIQNFLGYANLTVNFILGFFGMVFGPIIRQFQKPGPQKYFIAFGGLGIIVLLGWTVKEMIAVQSDNFIHDPLHPFKRLCSSSLNRWALPKRWADAGLMAS